MITQHAPLRKLVSQRQEESGEGELSAELCDLLGFGPTDGSAPGGNYTQLLVIHCSDRLLWLQVAVPHATVGPARAVSITTWAGR